MAITLPDRRLVLWASGVAVAAVLLAVRRSLGGEVEPAPVEPISHDPGESLRRWRVSNRDIDPLVGIHRERTGIGTCAPSWRGSSRWRPAIGRARIRPRLQATGQMLFGPELWAWVDPGNVARTGGHEPGPGRAALDEILQRMEQI